MELKMFDCSSYNTFLPLITQIKKKQKQKPKKRKANKQKQNKN